VGETQTRLEDAVTSYEQARQALRVAEIIPTVRPVASWAELGIYRTLVRFPIEELTASALHPGLPDLFADSGSEPLVRTLESYFDNGFDAKRTAAGLGVHRASLYYRLRKIEEITRAHLNNGDDRLALHLGLKLARLAGILPHAVDSTVD
jgi:sugar diacid utilization regulator